MTRRQNFWGAKRKRRAPQVWAPQLKPLSPLLLSDGTSLTDDMVMGIGGWESRRGREGQNFIKKDLMSWGI